MDMQSKNTYEDDYFIVACDSCGKNNIYLFNKQLPGVIKFNGDIFESTTTITNINSLGKVKNIQKRISLILCQDCFEDQYPACEFCGHKSMFLHGMNQCYFCKRYVCRDCVKNHNPAIYIMGSHNRTIWYSCPEDYDKLEFLLMTNNNESRTLMFW